MPTPTNELQAFIYQRITSDPDIVALVGDRVYDDLPVAEVPYPFISFGQINALEDDAECITSTEYFFMVHVWTRIDGNRQVNELCDLVKRRLHRIDTTAAFTEHALASIWVQTIDIIPDPQDAITRQGVIRVEALVEESDA